MILLMLRVLVILTLAIGGSFRLGGPIADGGDPCGASACHAPTPQPASRDVSHRMTPTAHCAKPGMKPDHDAHTNGDGPQGMMTTAGHCPMSGGPCVCAAAPAPEPRPDAPLPRSDRDSITSVPGEPPRIVRAPVRDHEPPAMAPLVVGMHADATHREHQAFLGIWRT